MGNLESTINRTPLTVYFWTLGGSRNTWKKLRQTRGGHANLDHGVELRSCCGAL